MADGLPLMIWVHDAQGNLQFVNRTYCEFFDVTPEQVAGLYWQPLVHPDDVEAYASEFSACVRDRRAFHAEVRVRRFDGEWRWLKSSAELRFSASGEFLGMVGGSPDLTDRKSATNELEQLASGLSEADRRKNEFRATLAHELQNPLAPIRNGLPILRMAHQPDLVANVVAMMDRQLGHLVNLVDDLLDVSRVRTGKVTIRAELMTVQEAVGAAVEACRPLIDEKSHTLEVDLPAEALAVTGDKTRLMQVVANLLTYAANYCEPGGRIRITAVRKGGEAVIRVSDTGLGIAPDLLPTLWDLFTRRPSFQPHGKQSTRHTNRDIIKIVGARAACSLHMTSCRPPIPIVHRLPLQFLLGLTLVAASRPPSPKQSEIAHKAVFILLDGIPADVIERVPTPVLDEIAAAGGYTRAYVGGERGGPTETPTISAPGYMSLLTATWANKHNVRGNSNQSPNYAYWNIFRIVETVDPSRRTALFSTWLDNRTVLVGEGRPDAGVFTLDHAVDGFERDTVAFPHDPKSQYIRAIDERVSTEAAAHIATKGPDLSWVYLQHTDDMGHAHGDSEAFFDAVRQADARVGRIWEAVKQRQLLGENWMIVVTTDHGRDELTGKGHGRQSTRERTTWIVTNQPRLDARFTNGTPAIVDIAPSILQHMRIAVPAEVAQNMDGVSFLGSGSSGKRQ